MRSSIRIGSAAALIIVALILIYHSRHGDNAWSSSKSDSAAHKHRKWNIGTNTKAQLTYQTQLIDVPNIGSIIMGKLRTDDTTWVSAELAEYVSLPLL